LAVSLGRRDEQANIDLAETLAKTEDQNAVDDLIDALSTKKFQSDAIKVLYELDERKAQLLLIHIPKFFSLILSKNNRIQWGAMTALYALSRKYPDQIATHLNLIIRSAETGSVITRDNAVFILQELCKTDSYSHTAFPLLMEIMRICPENQFAM
jgi:hypothetical protein